MFRDDERPEWDPHYAHAAMPLVDTPPSALGISSRYTFYLGMLLAHIHKEGYGYSDLHDGNVGMMPVGGLVVIDPGGTSQRPTTARACAGDFVVPSLEYSPEDFVAFWQGYLIESYKFIDPGIPYFCTDLRRILFGSQEYEPLPCVRTAEVLARTLIDPKSVRTSPLSPEEKDVTLFLLAIASLNWENAKAPDLTKYLNILDPDGTLQHRSSELSLKDVGRAICSERLRPFLEVLDVGRPISDSRNAEIQSLPGRPASKRLLPFISPFIENLKEAGYIRECLLAAVLTLAAVSRTQLDDAGTALTYGTLAFSIAASQVATLDELETYNLAAWRLWGGVERYTSVGPRKVLLPDPNVGLESALLFHKAACSDHTLLVRSLDRANEEPGYEPAWHAGLSAIEANRKCLLLLFYTLLMLPAEMDVPSILFVTLDSALMHRMSAESQLEKLATLTNRLTILTMLGRNPDFVCRGSAWAADARKKLQTPSVSSGNCLDMLGSGREYFAYVDLEVEIFGKTYKHSRQDIWHGSAQTFNEDRRRRSGLTEGDDE